MDWRNFRRCDRFIDRRFNLPYLIMVYRNVFFKKKIIQKGIGSEIVRFYGQLYVECDSLKNFRQMYDKSKDLYIPCTDCAANKYGSFIKVAKPID